MNIKIKSIKKSFVNVCNKFGLNQATNKQETKEYKLKLRTSKTNSTTTSMESNSIHLEKKTSSFSSASSGYGSSVESAVTGAGGLSVFVNLDNYFYNENLNKEQKLNLTKKQNIMQSLMQYEFKFLNKLKTHLEMYIRPLSALIDSQKYLQLFQNIEKIFTMTEFIRNTINESIKITNDLYTSSVCVLNEYISLIVDTYQVYLNGYAQAVECLQSLKNTKQNLNIIQQFIDLPIKNITKLYCTFMALLEMTPIVEADDYDKLSTVCTQLKSLIVPNENSLNETTFSSSTQEYSKIITVQDLKYDYKRNSVKKLKSKTSRKHKSFKIQSINALPSDFTDYDGNKHYFL